MICISIQFSRVAGKQAFLFPAYDYINLSLLIIVKFRQYRMLTQGQLNHHVLFQNRKFTLTFLPSLVNKAKICTRTSRTSTFFFLLTSQTAFACSGGIIGRIQVNISEIEKGCRLILAVKAGRNLSVMLNTLQACFFPRIFA